MQITKNKYIAHKRECDGATQSLTDHLQGVAQKAASKLTPIGFPKCGELIGIVHDIGKTSKEYQNYITGKTSEKVDHSTAGGQKILAQSGKSSKEQLIGEILSNCVYWHHGLDDALTIDGSARSHNRSKKSTCNVHEVLNEDDFAALYKDAENELDNALDLICEFSKNISNDRRECTKNTFFLATALQRLLYSALRSADFEDTDEFMQREKSAIHASDTSAFWKNCLQQISNAVAQRSGAKNAALREELRQQAVAAASQNPGVYELVAPTGAGKTYTMASYAFKCGELQKLRHMLYVCNSTAICSQTATVLKEAWIPEDEIMVDTSAVVAEAENPDTEYKNGVIYGTRWNKKIILTTVEQLKKAFIGKKSTEIRKFIELTNSVIIWDEVQLMSERDASLMSMNINLLGTIGKSTIVLCTATPINPENYKRPIVFSNNRNILTIPKETIKELKRIRYVNKTDDAIKSVDQLAEEILSHIKTSYVFYMNTKSGARKLGDYMRSLPDTGIKIYEMTTYVCFKNREEILTRIQMDISDGNKVLLIASPAFGVGLDASFAEGGAASSDLRRLIQEAGRINRRQEQDSADFTIYKLPDIIDYTGKMPEIMIGSQIVNDLLHCGWNLDDDKTLIEYNKRIHKKFETEQDYPIEKKQTTLFDLLSVNLIGQSQFAQKNSGEHYKGITCACKTAAEEYVGINEYGEDVVVRYKEASDLVEQFRSETNVQKKRTLIRRLQAGYVARVSSHDYEKMLSNGKIEIIDGLKVATADCYDETIGIIV